MISPITGGKKKKKTPPDNIRAYCLALDSVFPEVIPVEPSFLSSIFCAKKKTRNKWHKISIITGLIGPKHLQLQHELNQANFSEVYVTVDKFLQFWSFLPMLFCIFLQRKVLLLYLEKLYSYVYMYVCYLFLYNGSASIYWMSVVC